MSRDLPGSVSDDPGTPRTDEIGTPSRPAGRPSMGKRVATAIRIPEALHARLDATATERDVSINYLVVRAIERYLDALPPLPDSPRMMQGRFPKQVGVDTVDLAEAVDAEAGISGRDVS